MSGENNKPVQLLLDTPVATGEAQFNFAEYANALAQSILTTEPQMTIAVFGRWGTGKSTLLGLVKELLKDKEDVALVDFAPWRFQYEPNMALHLVEAIRSELVNKSRFSSVRSNLLELAAGLARGTTIKFGFMGTGVEFGPLPRRLGRRSPINN